MEWLEHFATFLTGLTPLEGVLLILVIVFHRSTVKSQKSRVKDRQREIDRLAKDNHNLRERNEKIMNAFQRQTGMHADTMPESPNQPTDERSK